AAFHGLRHVFGAQLDLLPPLMVYAGLSSGVVAIGLVSVLGGLWFDSLSANPLGISVVPLLVVGLLVHFSRDMVLRDQTFAQFVLGLGASAATPILTLILLLTTGHGPSLGWGTLWQIIVMTIGGAIATPVCFVLFDFAHRALVHRTAAQPSFRPDREI